MDEPTETARRTAAAMERADTAARGAGIRLVDVGPGAAAVALTVAEQHLNGHGICHGGYVFLLADAALAYASNSHGVSAVAAGAEAPTSPSCAPAHWATSSWPRRWSGRSPAAPGSTTSRCGPGTRSSRSSAAAPARCRGSPPRRETCAQRPDRRTGCGTCDGPVGVRQRRQLGGR